jgi:transposase
MWAKGLSYFDTAAIFNLRSRSCLPTWERLYRKGGVEALEPRKRGRKKAVTDPKEKPPCRTRRKPQAGTTLNGDAGPQISRKAEEMPLLTRVN